MRAVIRRIAAATLLFAFSPAGNIQGAESVQLQSSDFICIAHRGASGMAPEHTMPAYELGQGQGDYLEIDLHMTRDGHLIAMHDEALDRTTDGIGPIKEYTLSQIKKLEAGSWFNDVYPEKADPFYFGLQVLTLREVFEKFGTGARYFIETKSPELYPGMELELLKLLNEFKLIGDQSQTGLIIIQSFSTESLLRIHQMEPSIPLIQLVSYYAPAVITDKELSKLKKYAAGIGTHFTSISPGYVKKVRDAGLLILPYTVNEPEDMKMLLEWGVTGMFTNYPDRLHEVMKGRYPANTRMEGGLK